MISTPRLQSHKSVSITSTNTTLPVHSGAAITESVSMGRNSRRISCFDASLIPENAIRTRELYAFSVHYSVATSKWIATLARPTEGNHQYAEEKRRCVSFPFSTEREARKFAKTYSPPKMMTEATKCVICNVDFDGKCRSFNCRNCGACVCDRCSTRWGARMIPKTYHNNMQAASLTVRACKSCDWLSNAFCMALLQGKYEHAVKFHATGNVNLRSNFADIQKEAMFPIHCAVMGGNLECVKWLVDKHHCPISVKRDPKGGMLLSVQTSRNRTLTDLAMTGKPKLDILSYLVRKNLSVMDTKDPNLAPKTLQTLLSAGLRFELTEQDGEMDPIHILESSERSVATLEDACVICCEMQMDCVLTPCGHQVCCRGCGSHLSECPICKKACKVLRVFKL